MFKELSVPPVLSVDTLKTGLEKVLNKHKTAVSKRVSIDPIYTFISSPAYIAITHHNIFDNNPKSILNKSFDGESKEDILERMKKLAGCFPRKIQEDINNLFNDSKLSDQQLIELAKVFQANLQKAVGTSRELFNSAQASLPPTAKEIGITTTTTQTNYVMMAKDPKYSYGKMPPGGHYGSLKPRKLTDDLYTPQADQLRNLNNALDKQQKQPSPSKPTESLGSSRLKKNGPKASSPLQPVHSSQLSSDHRPRGRSR